MAFFGPAAPTPFHNPVIDLYSHRSDQMDNSRIYGQLAPATFPRPATFHSHVPGMYAFQQLSVMGCWQQTPPYRFPVPTVSGVPHCGNGEEYPWPARVPPCGNGEAYHLPARVPPCGNGDEYHWPAPCEPGPYERVFYGDPSHSNHPDYFVQNVCLTGESAFNPSPNSMIPSQRQSKDAPRQKRTILTCKFCRSNGETHEFYSSHSTVVDGIVRCPVLRKHVCGYCGATGDNAHTRKYCPKRIQDKSEAKTSGEGDTDGGGDKPSFRYKTGRTAAGGYSLSKF